jgi:hypothetical protein
MTDEFDVHDHRRHLKQIRDSGDMKLFENREGVACPACGEPFDRLFSTSRTKTTFPENDGSPFCLLRNEEFVHLFRH